MTINRRTKSNKATESRFLMFGLRGMCPCATVVIHIYFIIVNDSEWAFIKGCLNSDST